MLARGVIKRIGSGSSVDIWKDNWIPGSSSMKPHVRLPGVSAQMVDDLLLPNVRRWNEQLIHDSFISMDAEEILKIPLSCTMEEDVVAWAFERSGAYSVRSAYRLLKKEESRRAEEKQGGGSTSNSTYWWKVLQKLQVPPKARVFWWRVINGFLPAKAELKRRHIIKESHCETCGNPVEDLYHIIVDCLGSPILGCSLLLYWEEISTPAPGNLGQGLTGRDVVLQGGCGVVYLWGLVPVDKP